MEEDFWTKEEDFWRKWVFRVLIAGMAVIIVMQSLPPLPRKFVSERVLRSGMAIKDSICYRKPVAVGSILECRTELEWEDGEEEIVDLSFPLFGGERIEIIEKIVHIPCLPSLRETYLKYNGGRRL